MHKIAGVCGLVAGGATLLLLSACADTTSHLIVTHLGPGQGTIMSQSCDTTGMVQPACEPDGRINCPAPPAPLVPSDAVTAPQQRQGCFHDLDRLRRLQATPVNATDTFLSFGGANNFCGANPPDYCSVDQSGGPNNEVFVSFGRSFATGPTTSGCNA